MDDATFHEIFKDAIYNGKDYEGFIEALALPNSELESRLLDTNDPISLAFQKAYYAPRNQNDTAKAIYRLVSIGIIDSYTIDYQNKLYTIEFTKKTEDAYYQGLENLVARYTSKTVATKRIKELRREAADLIAEKKATVISTCLGFLTNFIYDQIKSKRLRAIEDMVSLCDRVATEPDTQQQNRTIKEEIYYYFNAKYSRVDFEFVGPVWLMMVSAKGCLLSM